MFAFMLMFIFFTGDKSIQNFQETLKIKNVIENIADDSIIEHHWNNKSIVRLADVLLLYGRDFCKLNPRKVLALAFLESTFNPRAYHLNSNGTNDQGFMQQNSAFWQQRFQDARVKICGESKLQRFCNMLKSTNRYDLFTNLIVSIHHLHWLKTFYDLTGDSTFLAHHGIGHYFYNTEQGQKYMRTFYKKLSIINEYWN